MSEEIEYSPTPFGPIPNSLMQQVVIAGGIRYDSGNKDWTIFSQLVREVRCLDAKGLMVKRDANIPIRYNNFGIALSEARVKFSAQNNTPEVVKHAILLQYDDKHLPKIKGFTSYSLLMKSVEQAERNYFYKFDKSKA